MKVLYRDSVLSVVNKPSGMLVHRGWGTDGLFAVQEARRLLGQIVWPVHRLDRGTSGALVFALDAETAAQMAKSFEESRVEKRYLALVRGITPERGIIDHPIPRTEDGPRVSAVTEYVRLGVFERYSLVEALPKTGRLHQIRRHLKHLAHPVIGDANYGKSEHNRLIRERFGLARLALHAHRIAFDHPRTGERLAISAPLPPDLAEPLAKMGLWK